jgi:hypothetical protein
MVWKRRLVRPKEELTSAKTAFGGAVESKQTKDEMGIKDETSRGKAKSASEASKEQ